MFFLDQELIYKAAVTKQKMRIFICSASCTPSYRTMTPPPMQGKKIRRIKRSQASRHAKKADLPTFRTLMCHAQAQGPTTDCVNNVQNGQAQQLIQGRSKQQ